VRLGIASGRLRQGETYVLDTAANTFDGFFLTAADSTETDSLASFGRVLASYSGGGRYAFADWDGTAAAVRVVGEGLRRGQIQVDVAVFVPDEPGPPAPGAVSR